MTDTVLLSANLNNIHECVDLAVEYGLGIELMAFALPDVLDGDWEGLLRLYQELLHAVPGPITIHGPFMDMASGSPDALINQVCIARYQHAIRIASRLEAEHVVLHPNFIGSIHNPEYRDGWHERNLQFWNPLADYAREHGVIITLENMWEFDPNIIGDVLREINHPNLCACLDVGHAHLFSDDGVRLDDWLAILEPWLIHTHMNNNNGVLDEHHGFDWPSGVLNYLKILPKLRMLPNQPYMILEMYEVEDMQDSLYYFDLDQERKKDKTSTQELPSISA